jgi:crossover junction endodeoxyribonuclease RuvC
VVFAACLERDIKIFEYAPTQVKSTVTGYGRADKAQVQKMVGLLLGVELKTAYDASDAVAIAICHASINRFLAKEVKTTC